MSNRMSISYKSLVEPTGYSPFECQVQKMIGDLVDPTTAQEISKRVSGLIIGSFPNPTKQVSASMLLANEVINVQATKK